MSKSSPEVLEFKDVSDKDFVRFIGSFFAFQEVLKTHALSDGSEIVTVDE